MGSDRLCRVKSSTTVNCRFISATLDGLITGGAYIGKGGGVVGDDKHNKKHRYKMSYYTGCRRERVVVEGTVFNNKKNQNKSNSFNFFKN